MFMRGLKRKKSVKTNVNFLTCSGVPALESGLRSEKVSFPEKEEETLEHHQDPFQSSDKDAHKVKVGEVFPSLMIREKREQELKDQHDRADAKQQDRVDQKKQKKEDHKRVRSSSSHGGNRIIKWISALLVIAVLALIAPGAVALIRMAIAGAAAKSAVQTMANRFENRDMNGAQDALNAAEAHVSEAKDSIKGASYWRNVPGVGTQIRALENASDSGSQALSAAQSVLDVMKAVLGAAESGQQAIEGTDITIDPNRSFQDLSSDEKRAMLARLDRALPDLKAAEAKIDIAVDAWNRIPQDQLIAPIRKAFAPIAESLPRLKQTIDEAEPLLEVFVPLAGYPKSATYLVLLQNSDEIRPTGGFIGTVGRLTIDAGEIKEFSFQDVYALDNPASGVWKDVPPQPIKQYLGIPVWYFRDSNWSPDFPTSAERLLDAYVREATVPKGVAPEKPDGIIAVNPPVFTRLMKLAGPITVDGSTFDSNNYFDLLEYQVEEGWLQKGISVDQRKEILTKLGDELFQKLTTLPASRWSELVDILTESFDRKQMMIYAPRPEVLSRLDSFGWTGRVKPTNDDYLWVVDANLAALKTDGVMEKNIRYEIDAKDPNHPVGKVTLRYTNHATRLATGAADNFKYTRYRSYTRVYVPEGAELISSSGAMKDDRYRTGGRAVSGDVDVMKELGKTAFGAFWSIEPNTTQELSFTYKLPMSVVDNLNSGAYSLDWQKQSGNDTAALTLDLSFGKNLKSAEPPEDSSQWHDAYYRVEATSLQDRQFSLTF